MIREFEMRNETMIKKRPKGIPRHGLDWYEIDINWWGIRVMQLLGLARTIKLVSLAQRFLA